MVTALERVAAERHESFRQAGETVQRVERHHSERSARSAARSATTEPAEGGSSRRVVRHPTLIGSAPPPRARSHHHQEHQQHRGEHAEGPRFHGPDWRLFHVPAPKPKNMPAYAGFSVLWWAIIVNGISALIVFVNMIMGFIAYQAQVAGPSIVLLVFHAWLYAILFYFHRAAQYLAFIGLYAIYLFGITIGAIVWFALTSQSHNDRYALLAVWFTFHLLSAIFGAVLLYLVFVLMKIQTVEENVASGRTQLAGAVRNAAHSEVSLRADTKLDVTSPGPITIRVPSADELRGHHQQRVEQHTEEHHHQHQEQVQHHVTHVHHHHEERHREEEAHVSQHLEVRPVPKPRAHSPEPQHYDTVPEEAARGAKAHEKAEEPPKYDVVPGDVDVEAVEEHAHSGAHDSEKRQGQHERLAHRDDAAHHEHSAHHKPLAHHDHVAHRERLDHEPLAHDDHPAHHDHLAHRELLDHEPLAHDDHPAHHDHLAHRERLDHEPLAHDDHPAHHDHVAHRERLDHEPLAHDDHPAHHDHLAHHDHRAHHEHLAHSGGSSSSEESNGHQRVKQTSSHESYVQIEYPEPDRAAPAPIFVDIAPYLSKSVRVGDSIQMAVTVHVVPKRKATVESAEEEAHGHEEREEKKHSDSDEEEEEEEMEADEAGSISSDLKRASIEPEQGSIMETPQLPRATKAHKRSTSIH